MTRKNAVGILCLFGVLSTCSGFNGMGELLIDAGQMLADAGNGNAQTATRTLTADTDASRIEGNLVALTTTGQALVTGPIVLTALTSSAEGGSSAVRVWVVPE